jgi:hypothetical protein
VDLAKLSREDLILAGLGIFLAIDLLFLPWYSCWLGLIAAIALLALCVRETAS